MSVRLVKVTAAVQEQAVLDDAADLQRGIEMNIVGPIRIGPSGKADNMLAGSINLVEIHPRLLKAIVAVWPAYDATARRLSRSSRFYAAIIKTAT